MHIAEQFLLLPPPVPKRHHRYGPSRLGYLDECAGFTSRSGTSHAAEDGTALHERMERILKVVASGDSASACQSLHNYSQLVELTDDERAYLRFCCERCDVYLARKPAQILTEIEVVVSDEGGKMLNHGTLDVVFIWGDVAIIIDFKFGWVPVKAADKNLQGMNYALGIFQKFLGLRSVGVEFDQPKLNWFSTTSYKRIQMAEMYQRCAGVIELAEFVQSYPASDDAQKYIHPGTYCAYCELSGRCAVLANHRALAATKFNNLPTPPSFRGLELSNPADVALARYWVDIIANDDMISAIKARAFEIAELNGGEIKCVLPGGEEIIYSVCEKNSDRSIGSPIEVSEALKEFLTAEEILGAAELAIGKLEPIAKTALVEAAASRGEKLTKKAAWEQVQSTLEANGLLSRPDKKIRYLKRKKTAPKALADQST